MSAHCLCLFDMSWEFCHAYGYFVWVNGWVGQIMGQWWVGWVVWAARHLYLRTVGVPSVYMFCVSGSRLPISRSFRSCHSFFNSFLCSESSWVLSRLCSRIDLVPPKLPISHNKCPWHTHDSHKGMRITYMSRDVDLETPGVLILYNNIFWEWLRSEYDPHWLSIHNNDVDDNDVKTCKKGPFLRPCCCIHPCSNVHTL